MINPGELKERLLERIWADRLNVLPLPKRWLVQAARTLYVLVGDVAEGQLTLRAMSLVYTTLLSLVPLLAVSFSVLKGFGVHNKLEPALQSFLSPMGERGVEISDRIIGFVSNVNAGVLGSLGLLLLFYTVISLLNKIEHAFNHVWHVSDARGLAQRFSDYLSVIMIGPVLVFSAIGLTVSAQSTAIVDVLREIPLAGTLFDAIGSLVSFALIVIAFTVIYIFVPNTRVKLASALLGGVIAGILWKTTGWVFASFVVSSAKYTAIYSAFASLIFFMIWLYLGWLILLMGSSIAYYHQHPEQLRRSRSIVRLSNQDRESLALQIALLVGGNFHRGEPPLTHADLIQRTGMPAEIVELVVSALCRRQLLREVLEPPGLAPTRPLENIKLSDVLDAVRGRSIATESGQIIVDDAVETLSVQVENAVKQALSDHSLRDLVESASHPGQWKGSDISTDATR